MNYCILFLLSLINHKCEKVNADAKNCSTIALPACSATLASDTIDYSALFHRYDSTKTYSQAKAGITAIRSGLEPGQISDDSLSALFTALLVHEIIPRWYGTPWDFNGYTAVPNQGVIACGYFVSTTLLHMGINVNRYKMAQQLPIHEAQTVACGTEVMEVSNNTVEENITELDSLARNGIYFLGLDGSHVGYLLKHNDQLFLIHANYIGDSGVTIEPIAESLAFSGFRRFYLAEISTNPILMEKWISGAAVLVVEG
jgi:hypothetical protein